VIIEQKLLRLKNIDYSQRGEIIDVIVDGVKRSQTVISQQLHLWQDGFTPTTEANTASIDSCSQKT